MKIRQNKGTESEFNIRINDNRKSIYQDESVKTRSYSDHGGLKKIENPGMLEKVFRYCKN